MPPSVYQTGVTIHEPDKAWNGYVLFGTPTGRTYLIDLDGNQVHSWDKAGFPSEIVSPERAGVRGHLLVQLSNESGPWGGIFNNRTIGELDWGGNVVWEWGEKAPDGRARQNHDWHRLENGNTLIVSSLETTVGELSPEPVTDQVIYEITPAGEIVWQWVASDHLREFGFSNLEVEYLRRFVNANNAHSGGFLTINNMEVLGPNRHYRAGDLRFHPDNIMIDSREGNFIAVIDKETGAIAWRMGPEYPDSHDPPHGRLQNDLLPRPVDQIIGQHDAHIIPVGLPGEGNLLVFDNQGSAGFPPAYLGMFAGSRVLEIDPITQEIVWQYTGENSGQPVWSFHSSFISSARRLPNGNTLIDEGMYGRIFQITRLGEIVWEYINPHFAQVPLRDGKVLSSNWIYRAQPVPFDWIPAGEHEELRRRST